MTRLRPSVPFVTSVLFLLLALLTLTALAAFHYQDLPATECAWCHRTTHLERHHIIPQATAPTLRDVRTNLVVLCRDCHFVLGHRCNFKTYNPDLYVILTTLTNTVANVRSDTSD